MATMMRWPTAKAWLLKFCEDHNPAPEYQEWVTFISYEELLTSGKWAIEDPVSGSFCISCGSNERMCTGLYRNLREFWKNWSIVTGFPTPPGIEDKSRFICSC
jgi:hypothetical protein